MHSSNSERRVSSGALQLPFHTFEEAQQILEDEGKLLRYSACRKWKTLKILSELGKPNDNTPIIQLQARLCYFYLQLPSLRPKDDPKATNCDPYDKQKINRWGLIIEILAQSIGKPPHEILGFLCLPAKSSSWERASKSTLEKFLKSHAQIPQNLAQIEQLTNLLERYINLEPCKRWISLGSKATPQSFNNILCLSEHDISDDSKTMVVLSSFFHNIPLDLFASATKHCKRWGADGSVELTPLPQDQFDPCLFGLLSDDIRRQNALGELLAHGLAIMPHAEGTCELKTRVWSQIQASLSDDERAHWGRQALCLVCRAVPWKYLDFVSLPAITQLKAYFKHVLGKLDPAALPNHTRVDLAFTLVEASRFPDMSWKEFATTKAIEAADGLGRKDLDLFIKQAVALAHRLKGRQSEADKIKDSVVCSTEQRMRRVNMLADFQASLNMIQQDNVDGAIKCLFKWPPVNLPCSPIEATLYFQRHMMLGRFLRYRGKFADSLSQHKLTQNIYALWENELCFDEVLRDSTCEFADTLRELNKPDESEELVRNELVRRQKTQTTYPGDAPLHLALAEALFAQQKYDETVQMCSALEKREKLFKFDKLRLYIILAKCYHIRSQLLPAFKYWVRALQEAGRFPLNNGRTTRIIITSTQRILLDTRLPKGEYLRQQSASNLEGLNREQKPGGADYWVCGLEKWSETLMRSSRFGQSL